MKLKYTVLLLFLVVFVGTGRAQHKLIDSLKSVLKTAKTDTTRSMLMYEIGKEFFSTTLDSSIVYWNKVIALADRLKNTTDKKSRAFLLKYQSVSYRNCGSYYKVKGSPDKALDCFKQSYEVGRIAEDKGDMAGALNGMAGIYVMQGKILEAMDEYYKALDILEKTDAPDELAYCLVSIGRIYKKQNEPMSALKNFERAVKLFEKQKHEPERASVLNEIASVYYEYGDLYCKDSAAVCKKAGTIKALRLYQEIIDILKNRGRNMTVAAATSSIAAIYRDLDSLPKAEKYAKLALETCEKVGTGNKAGIISASAICADIVLKQGKLTEAEMYARRALQFAKETGYPDKIMNAADILKKVYAARHDYKAALEMSELYTQMRDSTNNESTRKESIKSQFRAEYLQKTIQDSLLNAARINEEQLRSRQKISEQRTYTIAGIIGFLLMLAFAIVSLRAYRAKQKANRVIERNNKDLERQHLLNQKIFSVISHDFRGPILSLNMVLDKFKNSSDDPRLNRYLNDTGTAVRNANEVLNNLLNWAKTEINISGVDNTEVELSSIVSEIKKEMAGKLEEKQLRIVENVPVDATIGLPPDILRIVLRNLVSNAIKFSYVNNTIEVSFDADGQRLSVKDSGAGMSPETAAQLFRRQVNPEQGTNQEEGFGIGLYIVSELLYKYGYIISVESSMGKGTSFLIEPAAGK
jgi:signal transduction histidine kinase